MSLFGIHTVIYRMKNDPAARDAFANTREPFLARFELTPDEHQALLSGDVAALWRLGVHPLLLVPFSRMIGMPAPEYRRLLQPLVGSRPIRSHVSTAGDARDG